MSYDLAAVESNLFCSRADVPSVRGIALTCLMPNLILRATAWPGDLGTCHSSQGCRAAFSIGMHAWVVYRVVSL